MNRTLAVFALAIATSASAHADPRAELGVAVGGYSFSHSTELGANDDITDPGPASSSMVGLRAALPVTRRLALETELMMMPTKDDVLGKSAMVYGLRAQLRIDLLTGRLRPFVVIGGGANVLRSSSVQLMNDADQEYHAGLGVRYAVSDKLDVRLDVRDVIVPDRTHNGATDDYEASAGLTFRFGHEPMAARPLPAPEPAAPGDRDGDGIADDVDKCPDQPEDKDGFQDEDGCPDLDNDKDGIPDGADKCPNDPETINGYQDQDGCPDQVLPALGGIGFGFDSARLDEPATPVIDHAYEVLSGNPALSIQISGHSSGEGDTDHNLKLSLDRAEVVKAALVAKGIAPARILTVGLGADHPVADNSTEDGRRKNRRSELKTLTAADLKQ